MKEFEAGKIIMELTEARLELVVLQLTLGIQMSCATSLGLHPGSKEVLKTVSVAVDLVKNRMREILAEMDMKKKEADEAIALLQLNPLLTVQ